MRKFFLILLVAALSAQAQTKLPKEVLKTKSSVVSIITYRNGLLHGNGSAVLAGNNGEIIASSSIFHGADSAVAVNVDGKVFPVTRITGVNSALDCVKARISGCKNKPLTAASPANTGDELFLITYGTKKSGTVEPVKVTAVDSVYTHPYYTIGKPEAEQYVALPLVNAKGEIVAVMQPSAASDTVNSYAVGISFVNSLEVTAMNYGKGFFPDMKIRSALPVKREDAVSALYMQAVIGDSLSYANTINDFIAAYPDAYEGFLSLAEFKAVYNRDMDEADKAWKKALDLSEKKADVLFAKGKVINSIVQSGDTLSHEMLTFDNALEEIEKAIKSDSQPLYISYKADMLYSRGEYAKAYECYMLLEGTNLATPDTYSKAAQCKMALKEFDDAVAMLDSAVNYHKEAEKHIAAPYILTRALLKMSAKRYREAVIDYNAYEKFTGGNLNPEFYYMRSQAEVKAKMFQQALNDIDRAIYGNEGNVSYYIEKGMLCYRVKYTDEGIRTLVKAAELAPAAPDVHYLLGRLYLQGGQKEKAKESLEKALSLGHPDAQNQIDMMNK